MVEHNTPDLDLVFHALSDSTRRAMLAQLAKKECSISELAEPHDLTFAAISKHLKVLEAARFVEKAREGRTFRCRANLQPLDRVHTLLEELGGFWRSQLDALDLFLNQENNTQENENGKCRRSNSASKSGRPKKSSRKS